MTGAHHFLKDAGPLITLTGADALHVLILDNVTTHVTDIVAAEVNRNLRDPLHKQRFAAWLSSTPSIVQDETTEGKAYLEQLTANPKALSARDAGEKSIAEVANRLLKDDPKALVVITYEDSDVQRREFRATIDKAVVFQTTLNYLKAAEQAKLIDSVNSVFDRAAKAMPERNIDRLRVLHEDDAGRPPLMPAVSVPEITPALLAKTEIDAGQFSPTGTLGTRLAKIHQLSEAATGNRDTLAAEIKSMIDNPATAIAVSNAARSRVLNFEATGEIAGGKSRMGSPDARRTSAVAAISPLSDAVGEFARVRYGVRKNLSDALSGDQKQLATVVQSPTRALTEALAETNIVEQVRAITSSKPLMDEIKTINTQLDKRLGGAGRRELANMQHGSTTAHAFSTRHQVSLDQLKMIATVSQKIGLADGNVRSHQQSLKQADTIAQAPTMKPPTITR